MKITLISGSHRLDSQSAKIAAAVFAAVAKKYPKHAVQAVDLATAGLPMWDMALSPEQQGVVKALGTTLSESDALVVISPEWHGMVPAALKNFFLHYSRGQLAHKPALIISVSASDGGAYPIMELRSSSYKNSRICYLPEHLIVRHVGSVFNPDGDNDAKPQAYLEKRLNYCLELLNSYGLAFSQLRSQMPDGTDYPNGM